MNPSSPSEKVTYYNKMNKKVKSRDFDTNFGVCEIALICLSYLLFIFTMPLSVFCAIRVNF